MMHGFGDCHSPEHASACLIENIVSKQLHQILTCAAQVCERRGAKTIAPEDIVFLLRRDRVRMNRLLRYLDVKDMKCKLAHTASVTTGIEEALPETPVKKHRKALMEYLESIDVTGELTDKSHRPFDVVKHERNVRADRMSKRMTEAKYVEFSAARATSFIYSRNSDKFNDWLKKIWDTTDAPKIHAKSNEFLAYLARETVAEVIDMVLLNRKPNYPFNWQIPLSCTNDAAVRALHSGFGNPRVVAEEPPPIQPKEIREAMRKFSSSKVNPLSFFSGSLSSDVPFSKTLLTC
ncbi:transcription initiation protein SPT3 homolog isoform X2 [Bacillus rossius redtenbacheri]